MARLVNNIPHIQKETLPAARRALLQTGADIIDLTKQLAPVDTGALKQSYGAVPISSDEVHVGTDIEYAVYQEYGTSLMASQPHLTPAFLQSEETFQARLKEEMKAIKGVS